MYHWSMTSQYGSTFFFAELMEASAKTVNPPLPGLLAVGIKKKKNAFLAGHTAKEGLTCKF